MDKTKKDKLFYFLGYFVAQFHFIVFWLKGWYFVIDIKVLERICTRESSAVFDAGGLNRVLTFITEYGSQVHKDTLHSAMAVVSRLCGKMEPQDSSLETCVESLSTLLEHEDQYVRRVHLTSMIQCLH